jgi:hypothetical protein
MREIHMKLFGERFAFEASDETADRLMVAMDTAANKRRAVQAALEMLVGAGVDPDSVLGAIDPVNRLEVSMLSVQLPGRSDDHLTTIHTATFKNPDGSESRAYSHGQT